MDFNFSTIEDAWRCFVANINDQKKKRYKIYFIIEFKCKYFIFNKTYGLWNGVGIFESEIVGTNGDTNQVRYVMCVSGLRGYDLN